MYESNIINEKTITAKPIVLDSNQEYSQNVIENTYNIDLTYQEDDDLEFDKNDDEKDELIINTKNKNLHHHKKFFHLHPYQIS